MDVGQLFACIVVVVVRSHNILSHFFACLTFEWATRRCFFVVQNDHINILLPTESEIELEQQVGDMPDCVRCVCVCVLLFRPDSLTLLYT